MEVDVMILGHVPIVDTTGVRAIAIRNNKYVEDLIHSYDIGTVHCVSHAEWKQKVDEVNPLIIVNLCGDYFCNEVKDYKKDALIYSAHGGGEIFHRKATTEEKKEKNDRIFREIAGLVQKIRTDGQKEVDIIRKFSAMEYKDIYKMMQMGLISEDKNLSKTVMELLNDNSRSDFVWMRVQMMAEVWEHASSKQKEEMLLSEMDDFVKEGFVEKRKPFTDDDDIEYHQFEFLCPDGRRLNYIRRIPMAGSMSKIAYENLLDKYETNNYLRMQLEFGEAKKTWAKYKEQEAEAFHRVLALWKENPDLTKKDLNISNWDGYVYDVPLTPADVKGLKKWLKYYSNDKYFELFPEELAT